MQRFGNIAGLFQVMSEAIRALDKDDVDPPYMAKLAKIATAEIISTKVGGPIIIISHLLLR